MTSAVLRRGDRVPVLWRVLPGLTPYGEAIAAMHAHADAIITGQAREAVWILSSPAGYNPGIVSRRDDLPAATVMAAQGLAVDAPPGPMRAGDWSYHGPGVRAGIVMIDLGRRRRDLPGLVDGIHRWLIAAAGELGIADARREAFDPAGVWVNGGADKIAAIGLRLTQWVTRFGFAFYVDPDLAHFAPIKPCGIDIPGKGVTSVAALRRAAAAGGPPPAPPAIDQVDAALRAAFHDVFGPTSLIA